MSVVQDAQAHDIAQSIADIHMGIARELTTLHAETLAFQVAIGQDLPTLQNAGSEIFSLQGLDRHAQLLQDLAKIVKQLGSDFSEGRFEPARLRDVCTLPSTASAVFDGIDVSLSKQHAKGDVTLF